MPRQRKWKMPAWMKPFGDLIYCTGGNSVESMINDRVDRAELPIMWTMQECVKAQVLLLLALEENGLLKMPEGPVHMLTSLPLNPLNVLGIDLTRG